jgi:hypothetical protein
VGRPRFGRAGSIALGLLLLNVVVLASGLALEHWRDQPRAPIGYNADKVRLLNEAGPVGGDHGRAAPAASSTGSGVTTDGPVPAQVGDPAAQAAPAGPACFRVGLAGAESYAALRQAMAQAGLEGRDLRTEERLGWWVYWPPLDDPVQQVQALAAIDRAGVRDVAPIRKGPMARAISLGMFASEADARARHDALVRKGLTALRHGPRPGIRAVYLDLPAAEGGKLAPLRAALPAGVTLAEVACPG